MKRNNDIFRTLLLLLLLVAAACTDEAVVDTEDTLLPGSPGTLTIRFQNLVQTHSGASDASEYLIKNLIVALYPMDADEATEPVAVYSNRSVNPDSGFDGKNLQPYTVVMSLTDEMVETLFKESNTCRIFAIANIPTATDDFDKLLGGGGGSSPSAT